MIAKVDIHIVGEGAPVQEASQGDLLRGCFRPAWVRFPPPHGAQYFGLSVLDGRSFPSSSRSASRGGIVVPSFFSPPGPIISFGRMTPPRPVKPECRKVSRVPPPCGASVYVTRVGFPF